MINKAKELAKYTEELAAGPDWGTAWWKGLCCLKRGAIPFW